MLLPFLLSAALAADPAPPAAPADFVDDVKLLYDVLACDGATLPENLDPKAVESFCKRQKPKYQRFVEHWGVPAKQFLTSLEPRNLPRELVYPMGGGDLMMALVAFPDAEAVTTLSLELAGDPRRLKTLKDSSSLKKSLDGVAEASGSTLVSNDSKSATMSAIQTGDLPGQLSMHLIGLVLAGQMPVSVRFFKIEDDGSLHYYSQSEIDALESAKADRLNKAWKSPDFSPAFANVEVQFVPKGEPLAPRRTHRHIAANLSDDGLKKSPGVLEHLVRKGKVAMMTKAASYVLWRSDFGTLRDAITSHATFMVSDSTGVPPKHWKKAGCAVETYGTFQKSFLETAESTQDELRREWAAQPFRKLPMRFGYPDGSEEKRSHLMVARCEQKADAGR